MIRVGSKVKYVGPDTIAYQKGKDYEVTGYDDELDLYEVMSELDESYLLDKKVLKEKN